MAWFSRRSASFKEAENQRRHFRQSIELPIAVSVEGLPAPVYGTLVNISETGCRLRSLILLERQRSVEFELKRPLRQAIMMRGRIVTRKYPAQGGGYEYGIDFVATPSEERAVLSKEIRELQRREGATRAFRREDAAPASDATAAQRRSALRAMASFPIRYRATNRVSAFGEASDISMGGLRLACPQTLTIGGIVELRFKLPDDVLDIYPPSSERTEITPFGPRTVRIPDNRRPFEEMFVHGRIVSRFAPSSGREVYGVAFTDIDGYQREEIARFTHATQLTKLRSE
jgi:c-di-GMP-binding flagellar brake protein YcgR